MIKKLFFVLALLIVSFDVRADKFHWDIVQDQADISSKVVNEKIRQFLSKIKRIDPPKSLNPIFEKEGWRYRGAFIADPVQHGSVYYFPMVLNQSYGVFEDSSFKFYRKTQIFTLALDVEKKQVQDMQLLVCEDDIKDPSYELSVVRNDLDEQEFKKSLPNIFVLGLKIASVGKDNIIMDLAAFQKVAFNIEPSIQESAMSKSYGEWYYPYHLSVIEEKTPFKSACSPEKGNYTKADFEILESIKTVSE